MISKIGIENDSYNCECRELKTVRNILIHYPLLYLQQPVLKQALSEMDLPTLLNIVTG